MGKVKNSLEENLLSITFFTYTTLGSFLITEALRNVYAHYLNRTFPPSILVNLKHCRSWMAQEWSLHMWRFQKIHLEASMAVSSKFMVVVTDTF